MIAAANIKDLDFHSALPNHQTSARASSQNQESPEWAVIVENLHINLDDGFMRILLVR
jgi:hypothetical protein